MRVPSFRASFDVFPGEIVVDCFAGGGGASEGIEWAIGRPVDIAINHDPVAIAMHKANHPETKHYCEDIFTVDPREAAAGRKIGLLWASPSCTNHSRAKGGKPRDEQSRTTASVILRWAREVRPRIILLENVMEWKWWGPLDEEGQPILSRKGEDFEAWCAALVDLGYQLEFRNLVAADFGTPTTRERLFLIARCDGAPRVWPEATHGRGRPNPWIPASEIIDWSIPCPSIFDRKKPLVPATMRRIAAGIRKYVVDAVDPFVLPVGNVAMAGPTLIQRSYGERPGQAPRVPGLEKPLGTVVAGGIKHALVTPFIAKHYGGPNGHQTPGFDVRSPMSTITSQDHHALCAAWVTKYYGTAGAGSGMQLPLPTITTGGKRGGGHLAEVRAFLLKYYSGGSDKKAGNAQQQSLFDPLHTVTTKARFGLVEFGVVMIHGEPYQIVDIGMRMLATHELYAAQGFPDDYDIVCAETRGKPLTKTEQTALAGNSVCPQVAAALVMANTRGEARRAA